MTADEGSKKITLDIEVTLLDGTVHRFHQMTYALAYEILENLSPEQIFQREVILIAGDFSFTGFASSNVWRVDFIRDMLPEYPLPNDIKTICEMTESDFGERRRSADYVGRKRVGLPQKPGEVARNLAMIHFTNAEVIYIEMETVTRHVYDERQAIQHIMKSGFHCKRKDGRGLAVFNPRTIARWTFYPGPMETPGSAWLAHRMDDIESSMEALSREVIEREIQPKKAGK
ncbi:hypothetical protein HZA57_00105 [Candidatus Poribacteria bacterium]|nr:hypothetical protein [Candidatus Poribacteria bacterium]